MAKKKNTEKLRLKNNRIFTFQQMEMMGIINVTPDSFYEESRAGIGDDMVANALAKAGQFISEGARLLDVGGESTRPGSDPVTAAEEISRICPVIEQIRKTYPEIVISADTYRAETAEAALKAGADIINDISGMSFEPDMADVVADAGAAIILMHTPDKPKNMQDDPHYENVVEEVYRFLHRQRDFAASRGIGWDQIMIDMGIGFGKTAEHNLVLLQNIDRFAALGCPHLLAVSRKSFIGSTLNRPEPSQRLAGTLAVTAYAAQHGIACARVHDVKDNLDAARMAEALLKE